jgi:hypothetical protein
MKTIDEMAREAGFFLLRDESALRGMLIRFAELVRADEREAFAKVCDEARAARLAEVIRARGQSQVCCEEYNTCVRPCTPRGRHHGQKDEREACAKVCESYLSESPHSWGGTTMAAAIRARGNA